MLTEPRPAQTNIAHIPTDTPTFMALFMGSIIAVLLFALPAFAQSAALPIPENASAKSYGDGWECDRNFQKSKGLCVLNN